MRYDSLLECQCNAYREQSQVNFATDYWNDDSSTVLEYHRIVVYPVSNSQLSSITQVNIESNLNVQI